MLHSGLASAISAKAVARDLRGFGLLGVCRVQGTAAQLVGTERQIMDETGNF